MYLCRCPDCLAVNPAGLLLNRYLGDLHRKKQLQNQTPFTVPPATTTPVSASSRVLDEIQDELSLRSGAFLQPHTLAFQASPCLGTLPPESEFHNTGAYALLSGEPCNSSLLDFERWILGAMTQVEVLHDGDPSIAAQRSKVYGLLDAQLSYLAGIRKHAWDLQVASSSGFLLATKSHYHPVEPRRQPLWHDFHPVVLGTFILVAILHFFGHSSRRMCNFVLTAIPILLAWWKKPSDSEEVDALDAMGKDVRTLFSRLSLEPVTRAYICCPCCFKLYPESCGEDGVTFCTERPSPDTEPCGTPLYKTATVLGKARSYPQRTYLHQDFPQWLANLVSRPGMEDHLTRHPTFDSAVDDIWGASFIRDFKDRDGRRPFFRRDTGDYRYAFSLCVDGFGPFGTSSNKVVHAYGIFLVFLNLPMHLRYREENIFLAGIVPGPTAPSLDQLNHLLTPLVDDFCVAWEGLMFKSTPKHRGGYRARCAIVPVVCDMMAAKQIMALSAPTSANFCSYCWLQYDDINELDCELWPLRQKGEWLEKATAYRDASTQAARDSLVELHGIRDSELFRLQYFDPPQALTTEAMHLFYLRVFQTHTRAIWKMSNKISAGDANLDGEAYGRRRSAAPISELELQVALWTARYESIEKLHALPQKLVEAVCQRLAIESDARQRKPRRKALLEKLEQFRESEDSYWPPLPTTNPRQKGRTAPVSSLEIDEARLTYQRGHPLKKFRLAVLVKIAGPLLKKATGELEGLNKGELVDLLEKQMKKDKTVPSHTQPSQLLGGVLMKEVHQDMKKTRLHSSVASVPPDVGSKSAGTISADQSRTFFMRHLVITICRVFGDRKHARYADAVNFMHLVTAVTAAESHIGREVLTDIYSRHAHAYLTGLHDLHPDFRMTPSQHTLLHVPRFLRSMGPLKAHRAWVFERFIFLLKQIPTNMKASEAALTLFMKMTMRQNLRAMLSDASLHVPQLPRIIRDLSSMFTACFRRDDRGTLHEDIRGSAHSAALEASSDEEVDDLDTILDPHPASEDLNMDDLYSLSRAQVVALRARYPNIRLSTSQQACRSARLIARGDAFKPRHMSQTDSQIAFFPSDDGEWAPGEIVEVLTPLGPGDMPLRQNTFALVAEYEPLRAKDVSHDCWREFGPCAGRVHRLAHKPLAVVFPDRIAGSVTVCEGVAGTNITYAHALFLPTDKDGVILSSALYHDQFLSSAPSVYICP